MGVVSNKLQTSMTIVRGYRSGVTGIIKYHQGIPRLSRSSKLDFPDPSKPKTGRIHLRGSGGGLFESEQQAVIL